MKAIAIQSFGGPEKLAIHELPEPRPGAGEVLIRCVAAGVNPVDWKLREGSLAGLPHAFPIIPGWDVAGVVDELGEGCHRFRKGERVFAYARKPFVQWGTYAECVAVPERHVATMPANLLFEEAAAVPCAALTAYQALTRAGLAPGATLAVLNGSGGVGHFALQLAKIAGARSVGTAGPSNQEFVLGYGADGAIDHARDDLADVVKSRFPEGVDIVLDAIGGDPLRRALDIVKRGGVVVSVVGSLDLADVSAHGARLERVRSEPSGEQLEILAAHVKRKALRPHVQTIYPLDQAARAQDESRAGHVRGKLVLAL